MGHVSQPLKYRVGALAVGVSTAKELPTHHPFSVEIRTGDANNEGIHWKGEALQVVIGNTRLYADIVEMTPNAYIDDGVLDVCVITSGNPLTTMQQIASLLLRHQPDNVTAEYFQGAHFSLSVPASVALQLDGSAVKLKDYLNKADEESLERANEADQVMVTYNFDALPHVLPIAIPRAYNGVCLPRQTLFTIDQKGQLQPRQKERQRRRRSKRTSNRRKSRLSSLLNKSIWRILRGLKR